MDQKSQQLLFLAILTVGALGFVLVQARRRKWGKRRSASARTRSTDDGGTSGVFPWGVPSHSAAHEADEMRIEDGDGATGSPDADPSDFDGGGSDGGGSDGSGGDGGGGGGD